MKKHLILSILIIAVISMGAVSAAQNITDGDETIINDIETDNYQTMPHDV